MNDIASQCPSSGGLFVVKAINLLPVCDKSQYNNILDTCYSESQQQAYAPPSRNFTILAHTSVYPNPAKGVLYVNIGNVEFLAGEIRMIDALGKTAFVYPFTYGDARLTIPTGSLPEGFYLCSIYLDGRHHKTEKVIVSK
ncbi:MAG: T9SS type A sorting domain-containing protein [Saprospiraceae bacterium]